MFTKVESKTDISQIKIKVDKLILLHQELNENYRQLKSAYDEKLAQIENQKKIIKDLQETNNNLKLAESLAGSSQNAQQIKVKINEYIREIDRCMSILNS